MMALVVRTDGVVDRHFNRKCSRPLTQLLLKTPLTPNVITLLAMSIGLAAAAAFAYGGYAAGIVGAVLFQCAVVVDCCDGEVARIKRLESPFGDRLDVLADNVVHLAIVGGITWTAYREEGSLYLVLGLLAVAGMVIDMLVMIKEASADDAGGSGIDELLARLANRDFSVLILLFALIAHPEWFLWLAAVGSHAYWAVRLWHPRNVVRSE